MPTYQYACTNADCGNRFELVQKFTDPAADACPVCGSPVRKVFSSVGVVFKGSGFYRNDSREGANRPGGAQSESKAESSKVESSADGAKKKESASSDAGGSSKSGKDGGTSGSSSNGSSAAPAGAAKSSGAKSGAAS